MLRLARIAALCGVGALGAYAVTGQPGGGALDEIFNTWLYNGLLLLATATCVLGGLRRDGPRTAWLVLGAGMAAWTCGDIYYSVALASDPSPPFPSVADAFYLAFYPASYVALFLVFRSRTDGLTRAIWLDGALAALATGAVAAAAVFEAVLRSTEGSAAAVATNLVYPLGDMLLLAAVIGFFALWGWRLDRSWLFVGAGLVASALADSIYLVQTATGSYAEGTVLDVLWPTSMLLLAQAPWVAAGRDRVSVTGKPMLATPATAGLAGIAVLALDHFHPLNLLAVGLAVASLLAVLVRTGLTFVENGRLLARTRADAVTDALTGLGNRRRLLDELAGAAAAAAPDDQWLLVLFDLDGFKHYNDSYGHPAGDVLLRRLGTRLAEVAGTDSTYRLGGDEFCLLTRIAGSDVESAIDAAAGALTDEGDGFRVTSSFGAVFLPGEAADASAALTIADRRLYAQKRDKQNGRGRPQEVLLQALVEREPDLEGHITDVAALAREIGVRLGLEEGALDHLFQAALLHDIGKIAVPDSILRKPGPLDDAEWAFIRRHTLVGERILAASPALQRAGAIVRSTHERWDGSGYPDRLAGEEIPLEARVIVVCDAYSAMTSDRPYSAALPTADAIAEIRRCAGTHFDPVVAELLCETVELARTVQ